MPGRKYIYVQPLLHNASRRQKHNGEPLDLPDK